MVYLFHFELPVEEATWTSLATAYWPYLKSLTVSEVDACAAAVMHLSRACGAAGPRLHPSGGGDEGGGSGSGTACNGADGDGQSDVTFLNFFYVNSKKGMIACAAVGIPIPPSRFVRSLSVCSCLFVCFWDEHTPLQRWGNARSAVPISVYQLSNLEFCRRILLRCFRFKTRGDLLWISTLQIRVKSEISK